MRIVVTRLTKRGTIALKQVQKEYKQAKKNSLGRLSRVYGNTLWSSPLSGGKMKKFRLGRYTPCYLSVSVLGTKARKSSVISSVFFLSSIFEIRTYKDHRSLSPSKKENPLPVLRAFRNLRALLNVAVILYTIPLDAVGPLEQSLGWNRPTWCNGWHFLPLLPLWIALRRGG